MSNTIKLKRGSGSDPSASDLSVGELAIRTDSGKIFTKKDNGSVAEISGGGIDDGDKGDITVSNSGATFTIDSGVVNNAKVASDAAIAGSKISPTFTSNVTIQNATPILRLEDSNNNSDFELINVDGVFSIKDATNSAVRMTINSSGQFDFEGNVDCNSGLDVTGDITATGNLTISSDIPKIFLTDTGNNPDYVVKNQNGAFTIQDTTNSVTRFTINSNGHIDINDNLDCLSGVDVTGNITVTGTVDGRDVAADGSKLDGIESGATADQSASEILTLIKTVDGSGSGLDADLVDGIQGGSFLRGDVDDTTVAHLTFGRSIDAKFSLQGSNNPFFNLKEGTTEKARFQWSESGYIWIQNHEDNSVLIIRDNLGFSPDAGSTIHSIFHAGNLTVGDGGLTQKNFTTTLKNKLDGIAASATNNGSGNAITDGDKGDITVSSSGGTFTIDNDVVTTAKMINFPTGTLLGRSSSGTGNATTLTASEVRSLLNVENGATADQSASEILTLLKTVDGSGSGLDADTLDGANASVSASNSTIVQRHSSGYIFANFFNTTPNDVSSGITKVCVETGNDGYIRHGTAAAVRTFINVENGATADQSASEILTLIKTVDGAGSGLDADTLDGISSGSFLRSDTDDTFSAVLTLSTTSRDALNFSGNSTDDNRGLAFNGRIAISADYNDGYLRLNNASEFGNGVYTPLVMRADNGFQVDGTTVINGSAQLIASRLTGALPAIDGSSLTGISAGATGGGSDEVFYENDQTVTTNYTITNGKNAMAAGPITINSGVTVTVGSGETLTIV